MLCWKKKSLNCHRELSFSDLMSGWEVDLGLGDGYPNFFRLSCIRLFIEEGNGKKCL